MNKIQPPLVEEFLDTQLSKEENSYVLRAIRAGVQSTEILNVLVINRSQRYTLRNLIGAMENPEFLVYPLTPDEIQMLYTILKVSIKQAWDKSIKLT
jgi:hypothetical protein